jgi:hypothetical protein
LGITSHKFWYAVGGKLRKWDELEQVQDNSVPIEEELEVWEWGEAKWERWKVEGRRAIKAVSA